MHKDTGKLMLRYMGIVLLAFSFAELVFEIINVARLDMEAVGAFGAAEQLLMFEAGNSAVQMLLAIVGIAAGAAGIALGGKERYNSYLRWFGCALIGIYLIEGLILLSNGSVPLNWVRLAILLVVSALYLIGAFLESKELKLQAAHH